MLFVIGAWAIAMVIWVAAAIRRYATKTIDVPFTILGFLVIFCGSVLGYDLFHIPAPIPITSDRALLGLIAGTFCILLLRRKTNVRNLVIIDALVAGLLLIMVGSVAMHDFSYSDNLPISRLIFFYLLPFVLYFVSKNAQHNDWELNYVLIGFTALGCYLSVTGIFEVKEIHALVFPKYIVDATATEFLGRARGPYLNPISNGIFLTTALCCAVVLFWQGNLKSRFILGPAILLIGVGNIATLTRSVWMGVALGLGLVIWIITDRKQKAIFIVGGTLAAVIVVASLGNSLINFKRDKHVSANEMSKSAELRPIFAAIAWEMFKDRPIFGHGFGQYNRSKRPYLNSPNSDLQLALAKPYLQHNVFLSLLTELGIIGVGILVILLIRGFQVATQLLRHPNASNQVKMIALVLIAMLSSYVVNGMFHDTSIIPMVNMLMFFLLGVCVRIHQHLGMGAEVIKLDQTILGSAVQNFEYAR